MSERETAQEAVQKLQVRYGSRAAELAESDERVRTTAPEQIAELRARYGLRQPTTQERLEQRGVPDRIARLILSGAVKPNAATDFAFQLAEGKGKLLVLASEPGRGKSVAACWALSQASGLFVGSSALAIAPRREDNTDDVPANVLDARMRTCGLLVVDDLGIEHSPSGFAVARLDAIVTHRWEREKPTLLTTNMLAEAFEARYGARIASRVNGDALGWRNLGGPDLRGGA